MTPDIDLSKLSPSGKVEFLKTEIKEIISWAKTSIEREFSKNANPRTNCFASISGQIDDNRSFIETYIDKEEHDKVSKKIETLKTELRELRQRYTTKNMQPTNDEKTSLFKHLAEIRGMIE